MDGARGLSGCGATRATLAAERDPVPWVTGRGHIDVLPRRRPAPATSCPRGRDVWRRRAVRSMKPPRRSDHRFPGGAGRGASSCGGKRNGAELATSARRLDGGPARQDQVARDGASTGKPTFDVCDHQPCPASPRNTPGARCGRGLLIAAVAVFYAALLVAVVTSAGVDTMDSIVFRWDPAAHWPWLYGFLSRWVLLGQRAVCLAIAVPWLLIRALRHATFVHCSSSGRPRSSERLCRRGQARRRPVGTAAARCCSHRPGATRIFTDGTIFPSGHTANAVVTWVLLGLLVTRRRRLWTTVGAVVAGTVGATTVYLGTHWVTDVLAGWAAGALVLLAVPTLTPALDRVERLMSGRRTAVERIAAGAPRRYLPGCR